MKELDFQYCQIDPYKATKEEILNEIDRLNNLHDEYYNLEQALKIFLNSTYGALASPFFYAFNVAMAEAITLQGQDLAKYASKCIDAYFLNYWHKDKDLNKYLGLSYVNKINDITLTIYQDTDSCDKSSLIRFLSSNGKEYTKSIEEWYNENEKNGSAGQTLKGHESVKTSDKILNFVNNEIVYSDVKRIIRHKVSKPKWKLKTKSGKEIIVTNDHSMVVFRDGKQIIVKPSNILKTDKILSIIEK